MSIPNNIKREHLLEAIRRIDDEGIPKDGNSQYYDVLFRGKRYPPKLIVSYANYYTNGIELDRNSFSGGQNTPCFNLLQDNGFQIIRKGEAHDEEGYYSELDKFLKQALTSDLGTANYKSRFNGFKVKVSFGKGNQARIPWIAFLNDIDTVQEGIYPVYLFFKEKKILILAFGVSETYSSDRKWNVGKLKSIREFFEENKLGAPERYGNSFVFKAYRIDDGVSAKGNKQ
jgi:5-methylcytosine-specific restriction enzyme B